MPGFFLIVADPLLLVAQSNPKAILQPSVLLYIFQQFGAHGSTAVAALVVLGSELISLYGGKSELRSRISAFLRLNTKLLFR